MPTYDDDVARALLARARRIAHMLDARWRVPGTSIRFGLDPLVGLLPVAGDTLSALIGALIVFDAGRVGAPFRLRARMAGNLLIDWVLGLVPLLDVVLDTAFKANLRNVRLLERSLGIEPRTEAGDDPPAPGRPDPAALDAGSA